MRLATDLAGFTLQEADDVRRAMGKKKKEVLDAWKTRFIEGCVEIGGLTQTYAEDLWITLAGDGTDRSAGFADYCLAGDTRIKLAGGGTLTIEEIVTYYGDFFEIVSLSLTGTKGIRPTQFHRQGEKEVFTYELANGKSITCTPDHKFLTENGKWVSIDEAFTQGLSLGIATFKLPISDAY